MHNLSDFCSAGLGLQVEESGWTMSIALVQNQGWPPAQETHMELTTVAILRMWLFTVALAQVITVALDVEFFMFTSNLLLASFLHLPMARCSQTTRSSSFLLFAHPHEYSKGHILHTHSKGHCLYIYPHNYSHRMRGVLQVTSGNMCIEHCGAS